MFGALGQENEEGARGVARKSLVLEEEEVLNLEEACEPASSRTAWPATLTPEPLPKSSSVNCETRALASLTAYW